MKRMAIVSILGLVLAACGGSSGSADVPTSVESSIPDTAAPDGVPNSITTTTAAPTASTTAAPAISTTTVVAPVVDLEAVDWANHTYTVPCAADPPPEAVTLVDGEAVSGFFHVGLADVVFGSMGEPAQPVAVVVLWCIGAGSFPSAVLVYGGSAAEEQLLGVAASNGSYRANPDAHPWEVTEVPVIEDGVLVLTGEGWKDAPHCCADLSVVSRVGLDEDSVPYEIDYTEAPL